MKNFVLLFVCTGNTCRSPMAEGIMKDFVLDKTTRHAAIPIEIKSAGIQTFDGLPASRYAVEIAAENEINLNFHKSRLLTHAMVRNADLIITMEKYHTDFIHVHFPETDSVYELKNYPEAGSIYPGISDISDPMGKGREEYRAVFADLKHELNRMAQLLFPLIDKLHGQYDNGK